MNPDTVAEQLLTASTALAGLILVFLGNIVAAYGAFRPEDRRAVLPRFATRSKIAFAGFLASLACALLALLHNWATGSGLIYLGVACLLIAFGCTLLAAFKELGEIR